MRREKNTHILMKPNGKNKEKIGFKHKFGDAEEN